MERHVERPSGAAMGLSFSHVVGITSDETDMVLWPLAAVATVTDEELWTPRRLQAV